jgi:hypothetical protein
MPNKCFHQKRTSDFETSRNLQQGDRKVVVSNSFSKPLKIVLKSGHFSAQKKMFAENQSSDDSEDDHPIADLIGVNAMGGRDVNAVVGNAIPVR